MQIKLDYHNNRITKMWIKCRTKCISILNLLEWNYICANVNHQIYLSLSFNLNVNVTNKNSTPCKIPTHTINKRIFTKYSHTHTVKIRWLPIIISVVHWTAWAKILRLPPMQRTPTKIHRVIYIASILWYMLAYILKSDTSECVVASKIWPHKIYYMTAKYMYMR